MMQSLHCFQMLLVLSLCLLFITTGLWRRVDTETETEAEIETDSLGNKHIKKLILK